jgi:hypothetical protein
VADTWTARWAQEWAASAQRFNMNHAPAGSVTGGQFSSGGGGSGGGKGSQGGKTAAKPAAKRPAGHPAAGHPGAGHAAQKAGLRAQAAADRLKARHLQQQLAVLVRQEAKAHAAAVHAAAAAKKAHATARANANAASKKHATAAHHAHRKASKHHATLKQRIAGLRHQISTLLGQAKALDAQAAKL